MRHRYRIRFTVLLLAAGWGHEAAAQQAPGGIDFETYHLDNGLRVILAPDPTATAVAVTVWYDVGSRHERRGRSGFAHLFEHLMGQGSENVGPREHSRYVQHAGGFSNATASWDRTNYFQVLPPDRYNLALWLESDRMRSLRITEESLKREVEVVKEELRLRVDNAPYGASSRASRGTAVYNAESCFAYAHSVLGSMEDLDAAELRDVQEFFDMYYAPNNATLTISGSFDIGEARHLVTEYFGSIPAGARPPEVECREPFSHLPTRQTIVDANVRLPAFWASYGTVEAGHPDSYALGLLFAILRGGNSRLSQRLVRQERAALRADQLWSFRRGPGVVAWQITANQGVTPDRLEALFDEEIARVRREGVTKQELERAKHFWRASEVFGLETVLRRADALQWHNHFLGDPAAIHSELERHMAVTIEDIQRVADTYLRPEKRAIIITLPAAGARP